MTISEKPIKTVSYACVGEINEGVGWFEVRPETLDGVKIENVVKANAKEGWVKLLDGEVRHIPHRLVVER